MKIGLELSVAAALQVLQVAGGRTGVFNFLFGKTLPDFSQAVVGKRNLDWLTAVVGYRHVAESMQIVTRRRVRVSVHESRRRREGETVNDGAGYHQQDKFGSREHGG